MPTNPACSLTNFSIFLLCLAELKIERLKSLPDTYFQLLSFSKPSKGCSSCTNWHHYFWDASIWVTAPERSLKIPLEKRSWDISKLAHLDYYLFMWQSSWLLSMDIYIYISYIFIGSGDNDYLFNIGAEILCAELGTAANHFRSSNWVGNLELSNHCPVGIGLRLNGPG